MGNEDICESGNVLPVNLLISEMLNESPNLTNFLYDFDTNKYSVKKECPSWMNKGMNKDNKCEHGSIRITQKMSNDDLATFSSIGNLTGHGEDGKISCYYFPHSLNMYDGHSPTGGEIVIEFVDKKPPGGTPPEEAERVLIFIPVDKLEKKNKNSIKWFANHIIGVKSSSLNDIIPKAPFWVYNDIKLHGDCKSKKKTHGIFFLENYINIDMDDWKIYDDFLKSLGDNGVEEIKGKQEIKGDGIGWLWYPQKKNDSSGESKVDVHKDKIVRDLSKMTVRKCCIHKNVVGTTQGPGTHNKVGDPFSLTCEPILDADDDSPIDAKDRLEWVKDIYNGVPKEMKNMFMALVFICILVVVLMSIHIIIFKNIGLFITQNEIAGRIDN
jgi:hypothetical protein